MADPKTTTNVNCLAGVVLFPGESRPQLITNIPPGEGKTVLFSLGQLLEQVRLKVFLNGD